VIRRTTVVAIDSLIVVLALTGCVGSTIAPSPAAEAPPVVESAPPAVASRSSAAAPTPAPARVPSSAPKTVSKAPDPPKLGAAPPPVKGTPAPTLDFASLETRLRATTAIGVFTKLSLKNQVSDLYDQFKTFHHGGVPALARLRQEYDLLLLKVLSLLQDNDASLASAISASRESLWGILADPVQFAKLG
jgi:hypothetical protein